MADPISVAASIAGLIGIGIQVSQSLIDYYTSYRTQDANIDRTLRKLSHLLSVLQELDTALKRRRFRPNERAIIDGLETSIQSCDELIKELQGVLGKFSPASTKGFRATVKSTGHKIAYPFRQSTLQKLDEDIAQIRENLSLAVGLLQLNDASEIRSDVEDIKALVQLVRTSHLSNEILDWFQAPDASVNHNEACAKRNPGSGHWLVKGTAFTSWREDDNSFLWINGFAGCGKSVLCSTAIQHTFGHRKSDSKTGIAFFYFSFGDNSKQHVSSMLKALIIQLSNQVHGQSSELARLHHDHRNGTPPVEALMQTLQELVGKFEDVYLIIDALDESPLSPARGSVLQALTDFRSWSMRGLHVLVTSRDIADIRESIQTFGQNISMKNGDVDEDIANFVSAHLQQSQALQKWSPHHDLIRETLTAGAKGVFRWVECQFTSLSQCPRSKNALKKRLASLPPSLDETYERMLLEIDQDSWDDAKRILTLLCFAERPMTVDEIIEGIAVDIGEEPGLSLDSRMQDENDILQICPGFIDIESSQIWDFGIDEDECHRKLRIAHFSVQEYLESRRILERKAAFFSIQSATAHAELARICLVYLLDPLVSSNKLTEDIFHDRPLIQYAARYWYKHFKHGKHNGSCIEVLASRYLTNQTADLLKIHNPDYPWLVRQSLEHIDIEFASAVYYASLLGLLSPLALIIDNKITENRNATESKEQSLISLREAINAKGGRFGNALQAASYGGHKEVVHVLLDKGANINAQGGLWKDARQAASYGGYKEVVHILLDNGANVNAQGGEYGNALQAASRGGHKEVVHVLLDKGANVNAQGGQYGNALQAASRGGHKEVVHVLLDKGANIDAQGGRWGNALQAASVSGHKEVIHVLLDNGANVNAQGGEFGSALQAASRGGYKEVVHVLLDKGANIDAQGGRWGNALQAASVSGHKEVIHVLLDNGANVNAQGGGFGSALQAASYGGYMEVVHILLDKGANIDAQGGGWGNALQAASAGGHKEVIHVLLDKGANINAQGGLFGSALRQASLAGHKEIVQLLLDNGADINDTHSNDTDINDTDINDTDINDTDINDTDINDTDINDTDINDTDSNDTEVDVNRPKSTHITSTE